jgi:hypothetical protein
VNVFLHTSKIDVFANYKWVKFKLFKNFLNKTELNENFLEKWLPGFYRVLIKIK